MTTFFLPNSTQSGIKIISLATASPSDLSELNRVYFQPNFIHFMQLELETPLGSSISLPFSVLEAIYSHSNLTNFQQTRPLWVKSFSSAARG